MRHYAEVGVEDLAIVFDAFCAVAVIGADNVVIPMYFVVATRNGAFINEYLAVLDKASEAFYPAFDRLQFKFPRV